mgnify:CR=1 FL=1
MDALTVNSLRVIGREHGIKGYAKMRKSDLLNALIGTLSSDNEECGRRPEVIRTT